MLVRKVARAAVVALGMLLPLVAVAAPSASAETGQPQAALVRTLYYDTSQAQEFAADWDKAAANWNASVVNVRLVKKGFGTPTNIRIYADDGWPRAYVSSLGNGTVYMGRQAVWQGYYRPRITTHEIGHILGLPDRRTGLCSDLMSGSSAPVSCTNDMPNSAERAEVDRRFAGSFSAADVRTAGYSVTECYIF